MKARIAILFHKSARRMNLHHYQIAHLADLWRQGGHEVVYLFGPRRYVPADILFMHVDLSVVPEDYIDFSRRYSRVINGDVTDIRKSTFSRNILPEDNSFKGEVIVKTDLNYQGLPEWKATPAWRRFLARASRSEYKLTGYETVQPRKYPVFSDLKSVPDQFRNNPGFIMEKFQPEFDGDRYFLRTYLFLGDKSFCERLESNEAIIKDGNCIRCEDVETEPEIIQWRKQLQFDFGKFDYTIHDGTVVLLDVNKTTGAAVAAKHPRLQAQRRHLAQGIMDFL